ncbi:hypothetical protein D3C76_1071380 [compost metagenome]
MALFAPAPEMIEASTMVTYSSLPLRGSWPAMLIPLAWPQEAVTRSGAACSRAWRTASARVSIGVVVLLTWGAGSWALHKVPGGPRSTVTQRYSPSLYGGGTWANIISPRYTPDTELPA